MSKDKKIFIPSAPFKNYEEIEELAMRAAGEVKRIQIDVCDGKFVQSVSWPFTEYAKEDFEKLGEKPDFDVFLPNWETINYSADLMCNNPEKYLQTLAAYGIDEFVIHFRSILGEEQTHWEKIVEKCKFYEINLVLAVDVQTDLKEFVKFVKENEENINALQVMGIEKIGFQGQEFDERSLEIVKKLKKEFKDKKIYFDGGIDEATVHEIADAGVDVFCVGHYLTEAGDFGENLHELKMLIN